MDPHDPHYDPERDDDERYNQFALFQGLRIAVGVTALAFCCALFLAWVTT